MPDLSAAEFALIDWTTLDQNTFDEYIKRKPVNGKTLSFNQVIQAKNKRAKLAVPGFRPLDISGADLGAAPFANQAIPVDEFGVRWWFQYFWQEAKMVAGEAERAKMAEICNKIFEKTPAGPRKYKVKDALKNDDAGTGNSVFWRDVMTELLRIGFRKVDPAESTTNGPQAPAVEDKAAHHLMLQAKFAPYMPNKLTPQTEIFWRSESRSIERIVAQGGTKRQADVACIAKDMNISAPWHPFSEPTVKRYMWFRLGQGDNDYYTVISVATDFETALAFPKIDEARIYGFPPKPIEQWSRDEVQMHRANLALVSLQDGNQKVMLATSTTAYMCVACGRVIDTRSAGGKVDEISKKVVGFPEKGVSEISLDQIFAYLPMTRIHHGPKPDDGFTAFPDIGKGNLLTGDFGKAMDLFGDSYDKCCAEYFKKKYGGAVVTAWGANGAASPRIQVNVSRILEFPIGLQALEAFKKARTVGAVKPADFIQSAGLNVRNVLKPTPKK
jgi:ribosomal protein S27E